MAIVAEELFLIQEKKNDFVNKKLIFCLQIFYLKIF